MINPNDIKRAIDTGLADAKLSEQDKDDIMRKIRENRVPAKRLNRKLPVAVLIALLVLLASAIGFAAMSIFGGMHEAFQIEKEEGDAFINDWSFEHKLELVEILQNAGAELNSEKLELVYGDELSQEEKDRVIMELLLERFPDDDGTKFLDVLGILVSEKGQIDYWTHEERAQLSAELYGDTLNEPGDWLYAVPGDDDLSESEALEIAYDYYESTCGISRDQYGPHKAVAFEIYMDKNRQVIRLWQITLQLASDTQTEGSVTISIANDGSILEATEPETRSWRDDWYDLLVGGQLWTIENLYQFRQEWTPRVAKLQAEGTRITDDVLYLLDKPFGLPSEDAISRDAAYQIAEEALLSTKGWTRDDLKYYAVREGYLTSPADTYCFVFSTLSVADPMLYDEAFELCIDGKIPISIRICVQAKTGEITEIYQNDDDWGIVANTGF